MPSRPVLRVVMEPEKPIERISKERAEEIMREVGFRPMKFGGGE